MNVPETMLVAIATCLIFGRIHVKNCPPDPCDLRYPLPKPYSKVNLEDFSSINTLLARYLPIVYGIIIDFLSKRQLWAHKPSMSIFSIRYTSGCDLRYPLYGELSRYICNTFQYVVWLGRLTRSEQKTYF